MIISMPMPIREVKARRLETQASRYGAALYTGMMTESVINNSTINQGSDNATSFIPLFFP